MGANAISRPQTQRDLLRMSVQVKGSPFDSVRRWQTPEMGLDFPDTEEVTGSNPVRPTPFFEILYSSESLNESQPPATLPHSGSLNRCQVAAAASDHTPKGDPADCRRDDLPIAFSPVGGRRLDRAKITVADGRVPRGRRRRFKWRRR